MKVLHLIGGGDVGGAKSHVLTLVRELGKHIDVKLISLRPGAFADDARSMGINVEVVKKGNIISDIKRVLEIVREGNYDIIHSHGAKANMFSVIIKRFFDIPTVTTVHSDYRLDYLQSILKRLSFGLINTISLRFIDYHIGVSDNFKEMLVKRKFNSDLIFTVYNGIDFEKEIPQYSRKHFLEKHQLHNVKDDDVLIGILARLDPVKGLNIFIQAAKIVLKKYPNAKFLIGGDGKERASLERKVTALGISDSVYFLGFINEPFEFMSSIDINLLTSLSESFPYVILEGSRLKKATISSNVGGISDLIENGENGFLFTPGDFKKLAEYIILLLNDKSLRNKLGENLFNKAQAQFSLKNMCATQLSIYEKIYKRGIIRPKCPWKYDAIISGYYGFRNIGDDSMLMAIINNLKSNKSNIRILVLSKRPSETRTEYKVDSINRFNILHIMCIMKNSKLFINGGGSLIQDNTSTRSLIYYLSMMWFAKRLGMKVMIYANGIGPLNKESNRKLANSVINQVDAITLREQLSKDEVDNLLINKPKITITADPAMTISPVCDEEIDKIFIDEGIGLDGPFIGFSVRMWSGSERYENIIARTADYLIEKYKIKPVFIPMQHPFDLFIIERIISKMKGKGYVIRKRYDGRYTLGIIKRMQVMVGMRLHALIFAVRAKVPIVALAYDQKVEGFLRYINLSPEPSAGHIKSLDFDRLIDIIDNVWKKRAEIIKQMEEKSQILQNKATEDAKIAITLIEDEKC